jgi:hypothetical protein
VTDTTSAHEWAAYYASRDWAPVPVPYREKAPRLKGWQTLRLRTADDIAFHFNGHEQNVGIITGEPSANLVDIDLDASEARALAAVFLPPTVCCFGRLSKPESHWIYRTPSEATTKKFKGVEPALDGSTAMLVELRSGGGVQTVFPGSVHPTGELITFVREESGSVHSASRPYPPRDPVAHRHEACR